MATTTTPTLRALYASPTLEKKNFGKYKLSFYISLRSIQYVLTGEGTDVLLLNIYRNERNLNLSEFLDKIWFEDKFLGENTFGSVEVIMFSKRWTLAPNEHIREGEEAALLQLYYDLDAASHQFFRDPIKVLKLNVVYAISQLFLKRCEFYFKAYTLRHVATPLLQESFRLHQELKKPLSINMGVFEEQLFIVVFQEDKLLFCNNFEVHFPEDALFYYKSVIQHLNLATTSIPTYFTGRSELRPAMEEIIRTHFKELISVRELFPKQPTLNKFRFYHDEFSHLLTKPQ